MNPDPDPALLALRRGYRLVREADAAELFTCHAHGLARALEELAAKSSDSRHAADARRLSGRRFLL